MFDTEVYTDPTTAEEAAILMDASIAVRTIRSSVPTKDLIEAAQNALVHASTASVLEQALGHVLRGEPTLVARLRDEVLPDVHRRPVGPQGLATTASPSDATVTSGRVEDA